MSASPSRCPRCGYVLRHSKIGYTCDFCGLKGRRPASSIIASLERSLRRRVQDFLEPRRTVVYNQPVQRSFQICIFCGQNIPFGSLTCPACRKPQALGLSDQDRRVFDYITAHDGTISISNAAIELSISINQLTASIEHLKASGVLRQE
jgi:hypothetical protein